VVLLSITELSRSRLVNPAATLKVTQSRGKTFRRTSLPFEGLKQISSAPHGNAATHPGEQR
jgi:hypothetical protein